jgi:hypothetical protein
MAKPLLTLREARETGRLKEFVRQQEALGIDNADKGEFDAIIKRAVTQPRSEGRTSRSASRGGSTGK